MSLPPIIPDESSFFPNQHCDSRARQLREQFDSSEWLQKSNVFMGMHRCVFCLLIHILRYQFTSVYALQVDILYVMFYNDGMRNYTHANLASIFISAFKHH